MKWSVLYLFHLTGTDVYALTPLSDPTVIPRISADSSWNLLEVMERNRLVHPMTPDDEQALEALNRDGFYVFKMPDGYTPPLIPA
jgi:hypothetical protein